MKPTFDENFITIRTPVLTLLFAKALNSWVQHEPWLIYARVQQRFFSSSSVALEIELQIFLKMRLIMGCVC